MKKRTYGVELEGYVDANLIGESVGYFNIVDDGSLSSSEECYNCDGSGYDRYDCEECYGRGHVDCNECEGMKHIDCGMCDGSGENDEGEECSNCGGEGSFECDHCDCDGDVECGECGGGGSEEGECGSCDGRGTVGMQGIECVSDILRHGEYSEIDNIFDHVKGYDWTIEDDCGTHVHVGASDLDAFGLRNLAVLMNIMEPVIYGINHYTRCDQTYCYKTRLDFIDRLLEIGDDITLPKLCNLYYDHSRVDEDNDDVWMYESFSKYEDERYYGLNLHSWFYREGATVEFRYFHGSYDPTEVKAWIDMCVKLVEFAKHTTLEQLIVIGKDFYRVDSLTVQVKMLKELLDLEYDIRPICNMSFDTIRRNVAYKLRYVEEQMELAI